MSTVDTQQKGARNPRSKTYPSLRLAPKPWMAWVAGVLLLLAVPGILLANKYWPYRYRNVKPLLQNVLASKVTIEKYHRVYFPSPGFVATGLTLRRATAPDLPPIGSVDSLIVRGSWLDLLMLRQRVQLVEVQGLHVVIPPEGSRAMQEDFPPGSSADFAGPEPMVAELRINNGTLDILRTSGGRYTFPVRQLVIRNLQKGKQITYDVDMQNAQPAGHILSKGKFGPLNPNNLGGTPVSGDFTFTDVRLSDIGTLGGTLNAADHFEGTLDSVNANATASTSDLSVNGGRPTKIDGTLHATVNGLTGGVVMHTAELKVGTSKVEAQGSFLGSPKVTTMEVQVANGQVQELMRPFLKSKPPIKGAMWMHSHVVLLPVENDAKFLQRLKVDGVFNVPAERFADKTTEQSLSDFSRRAQGIKAGEDAPEAEALSSADGSLTVRDGIVHTDRLTFKVAGASVVMNGTFDLRTGVVHMLGTLKMQSDISHATTGFKSFLLKPFAPFFKRKDAGAVVPVALTGSPNHYKAGQDILHTK